MQIQAGWTQRIARTQAIMSAAWQILWEDKTLLLLPIASSASLMLLTASFAVPAILGALTGASMADGLQEIESWSYAGMFLFYVVAYGVAIFFNAALAICVLRKLEGKQATILDGLREALSVFLRSSAGPWSLPPSAWSSKRSNEGPALSGAWWRACWVWPGQSPRFSWCRCWWRNVKARSKPFKPPYSSSGEPGAKTSWPVSDSGCSIFSGRSRESLPSSSAQA